jgi:hypothetical protein
LQPARGIAHLGYGVFFRGLRLRLRLNVAPYCHQDERDRDYPDKRPSPAQPHPGAPGDQRVEPVGRQEKHQPDAQRQQQVDERIPPDAYRQIEPGIVGIEPRIAHHHRRIFRPVEIQVTLKFNGILSQREPDHQVFACTVYRVQHAAGKEDLSYRAV